MPKVNPSVNPLDNRFSSGQGWSYDAAGNMTVDAQGRIFINDVENRQIEVRDQYNTVIGQYFYNGDGQRIKKIIPATGETTVFVYNAGGTLVAEYSTELAETQQVSYLTQDHLGSPRVITNENGAVVSSWDFTAFGEEAVTAQRTAGLGYEEPEIRKNYTGYEKDAESGLDYAINRTYDSKQGRFTQVDPLTASASIRNPQTFNRYSYVLNSPYKYVDPLGLMAESPKDKKWEFKCDFNCRVKSGNMTKQDMVLMEWHISNNSALGYWYLNLRENASSRPSEQSPSSTYSQGPNPDTVEATVNTPVTGDTENDLQNLISGSDAAI